MRDCRAGLTRCCERAMAPFILLTSKDGEREAARADRTAEARRTYLRRLATAGEPVAERAELDSQRYDRSHRRHARRHDSGLLAFAALPPDPRRPVRRALARPERDQHVLHLRDSGP